MHDDLSALSWLILAPTQQSMRYLLHLEMRNLRLQEILCYSFPSSSNCQVMKLGLSSGSSASSTQNLTSTQAANNSPPLPSQIPLKKFLFVCLLPHLSFTPQPAAVCFLHSPSAEIAPPPFQGHQRRNGQSQRPFLSSHSSQPFCHIQHTEHVPLSSFFCAWLSPSIPTTSLLTLLNLLPPSVISHLKGPEDSAKVGTQESVSEISLVGVEIRHSVQRIKHAGQHSSKGPTVLIPLVSAVRGGGEVREQK